MSLWLKTFFLLSELYILFLFAVRSQKCFSCLETLAFSSLLNFIHTVAMWETKKTKTFFSSRLNLSYNSTSYTLKRFWDLYTFTTTSRNFLEILLDFWWQTFNLCKFYFDFWDFRRQFGAGNLERLNEINNLI